jgi:hypothetical protein
MQGSHSNRITEIFSIQRLTRERHETLLFIVIACTALSLTPLLAWGEYGS